MSKFPMIYRVFSSTLSTVPPAVALAVGLVTVDASAQGEEVDGYPNWDERVLLELTNRARVAPQIEMEMCGENCTEAECYSVKPPLFLSRKNSRAARFHGANMGEMGFFAHTSKCTLAPDLGDTWENGCDGAAACACLDGVPDCNPSCTSPQGRVGLFGGSYFGEIIAGGSSPTQAFYLWLYEPAGGNPACMFTSDNGHRWLLLTSGGAVGFGADGYYVGDFGGSDPNEQGKIASGVHWPRAGNTVEAWANWYDEAAPSQALVNVDGSCQAMALSRGSAENGAYMAQVTGVGQGCHRYYYVFKDGNDALVTYPSTGSLGIGQAGACETWTDERPALGPGCDCTPSCGNAVCGDDGCGGSCGDCSGQDACMDGACLCVPACDGKDCGEDGCGGTCGSCIGDDFCDDGVCVTPGDTDVCVPDCKGRECGDDGCGSVCGSCEAGQVCGDGLCLDDGPSTTDPDSTGSTTAGTTGGSSEGGASQGDPETASSGPALPDTYGGSQSEEGCGCRSEQSENGSDAFLLMFLGLLGLRVRRR